MAAEQSEVSEPSLEDQNENETQQGAVDEQSESLGQMKQRHKRELKVNFGNLSDAMQLCP